MQAAIQYSFSLEWSSIVRMYVPRTHASVLVSYSGGGHSPSKYAWPTLMQVVPRRTHEQSIHSVHLCFPPQHPSTWLLSIHLVYVIFVIHAHSALVVRSQAGAGTLCATFLIILF